MQVVQGLGRVNTQWFLDVLEVGRMIQEVTFRPKVSPVESKVQPPPCKAVLSSLAFCTPYLIIL